MDIDTILSTLARVFASEGETEIVALLATCDANAVVVDCYQTDVVWIKQYQANISVLPKLFSTILSRKKEIEEKLLIHCKYMEIDFKEEIVSVVISPKLIVDDKWQEKAQAWLIGEGVNNQARVRSNNIASRECDGLLFRSQTEIRFYKELKSRGITFAPLAVFIKGGDNYRRIEPDFYIVKDGISMVVEIDGDTIHMETPSEAHDRLVMLNREGVHVERIKASDLNTDEMTKRKVTEILQIIDKFKTFK